MSLDVHDMVQGFCDCIIFKTKFTKHGIKESMIPFISLCKEPFPNYSRAVASTTPD